MNRQVFVGLSALLLLVSCALGCGAKSKTPVDFRDGTDTGWGTTAGNDNDLGGGLQDMGGGSTGEGGETAGEGGETETGHEDTDFCQCRWRDNPRPTQCDDPGAVVFAEELVWANCSDEIAIQCYLQDGCRYQKYRCTCLQSGSYSCVEFEDPIHENCVTGNAFTGIAQYRP